VAVTDDGTDLERDTLTVQVQGGRGEPERVIILSRPRDGMVDVREFAIGGDAGGSSDYTCACDDVLATVERAVRERRRVSEDLATVRRWLNAG
jgi:hypothetical protein